MNITTTTTKPVATDYIKDYNATNTNTDINDNDRDTNVYNDDINNKNDK